MDSVDYIYETEYEFFKIISTSRKCYFCDFHKLLINKELVGYRVLVHTQGYTDTITDLFPFRQGKQYHHNEEQESICPELRKILLAEILYRNSGIVQ